MKLRILSGGAAQGLVAALAPAFEAETGCAVAGTFSAVGAMRDALLGGAPADLIILTAALIDELVRDGHVVPGSALALGTVRTGVAVRDGDPIPTIGDGASLAAALGAADEIHLPDPERATAGIHFKKVLEKLGLLPRLGPRLRAGPNGATAMAALAASPARNPIGCTQVTEILATPGLRLVGVLPQEFELATVYTAGVARRAAASEPARRFIALLTGEEARATRRRLGFEPTA
jgi:molybdate transport system substrate-binding protein